MKLLMITAAFPPIKSGGSDFAMRMADEISSQGTNVYVLTSASVPARHAKYDVIPAVRNWNWADLPKCFSTINQLQPDVIDIHFACWIFNDHPMITLLPSLIKRAAPHAHLSVHFESLGGIKRTNNSTATAAMRWLVSQIVGRKNINYEYGCLVRDSDSLIFLNHRDRDELARMFPAVASKSIISPPPPIMPIAPTVDAAQRQTLLKQWGLSDKQFILSFYGYLYPGKGIEVLFQAMKELKERSYDPGLLLIGDVPEEKVLIRAGKPNYLSDLKALAQSLGIADSIRWVGYSECKSETPSQLIQVADMCVMPFDDGVMLHNSTFSFAARHGKPIVTTRGINTDVEFCDDENAVLVNPRDAGALAGAIVRVLEDSPLRERIAAGALSLANEVYSWERTMEQLKSLWSEPGKQSG